MEPARPSILWRPVSHRRVALVGVLSVLLVGVGDFVTGIDTTFTLMYLLPLGFSTWFGGWHLGAGLTVLASALGWVEIALNHAPDVVKAWNQMGSFVIFMIVVFLIERLRRYVEQEQRQRHLAVEQLRHAERLNVIGVLAAGVAHELGTPLNVISGNAELLPGSSPEEVREMAEVIREQTGRISAIIKHLLEFGRRAGGSQRTLDLNDVARAAVALLGSTARKRSSTIRLECSDRPVKVSANAAELEQVFSNLILNALQAMPTGGEVTVAVSEIQRSDPDGATRGFGAVRVADTGTGIAPADVPKIFDPFFTTKGVGDGTGLGLSVSYGIVEDHRGRIEVDSVVGTGTTIAVLLPVAIAG